MGDGTSSPGVRFGRDKLRALQDEEVALVVYDLLEHTCPALAIHEESAIDIADGASMRYTGAARKGKERCMEDQK